MVQSLLNNLNIIKPETTPSKISSKFADDTTAKTDFQKLFDRQKTDFSNDKSQGTRLGDAERVRTDETEETDDTVIEDKDSQTVTEKDTFAGSIAFDFKQLIEFVKSASKDDSDSNEDTEDTESINDIEGLDGISDTAESSGTEELDAEKITKNLLHIEDDEDKKKEETGESESAEQESMQTDEVENTITYDKLDSFLQDFEITPEEVETTIETQTAPKEASGEKVSGENSEVNLEDIISEEELKELNIESVEAETSGSNNNEADLMQHQSAEEQGVKAMIQGEADFSAEIKPAMQTQAAQNTNAKAATAEISPSRIIEQITKQMEGIGNSKVNIVLNPESLGKVSVQLINTKEGLSAQFTVATQEAKSLIMKGLDGLKDTLVSHGVSVDNVTVKLNDTQESEYNADWTEQEGSRGGNKEQNPQREQRDKEQFEKMMSFIENENGKV